MKKKQSKSQVDIYYHILEGCVGKKFGERALIAEELGINFGDNAFNHLQTLKHINIVTTDNSCIELLPQGFSTYLTLSSQKQSDKQFKKSVQFATWALVVSIISFIISIVFSIISS